MCGIAGFFSTTPVARSVADDIQKELARRGPDAQHQVFWDAGLNRTQDRLHNALIHTRLSIIDPRPLADQPMCNQAGDIWIAYNGEVYDWARDAAQLKAQGAAFRTRSDTEFILKAYEAWGIECLSRLRGMFAIAILDLREHALWLARDRMGLKPLTYSHIDGRFAFGSTVRAVVPFLAKERRNFSPQGIDAYLAHRYVPAPMTLFENVKRLENGHLLRFDLRSRELQKSKYWFPKPVSAALLPLLDEAISIRTVADRPLGVFLSSGVDSSVIASRLSAMGRSDLQTLTASFPGSSMDESEEARVTAERLGLANLAVPIPQRISADFARIVADLDEPFADPSSMPTWYLCRATTSRVKVVLGGDGLDELLGGYKRLWKHVKTSWRRNWSAPWLPIRPGMSPKGWAKWSVELKMSWLDSYSLRFSGFTPNQRQFLQPELRGQPLTYWRAREVNTDHPLSALLELDRENYLPEYILRKADLCSMAHGLELRAPFLDHHWVQALMALPEAQKFTQPPKLLLENVCPELRTLDLFGRKKRGFNPPLRAWLAQDLPERFEALGSRLAKATQGQVSAAAVDSYCKRYLHAANQPGEQLLQLLILDESLAQLRALAH